MVTFRIVRELGAKGTHLVEITLDKNGIMKEEKDLGACDYIGVLKK